MLVLWIVIESALRGHRLGAWALCQVIETMMPTSNGLMLVHPHWDAEADATHHSHSSNPSNSSAISG